MNSKNANSNGENVTTSNLDSIGIFFFLKIINIGYKKTTQSHLKKDMPYLCIKHCFFISFTSLIGMK
jgi:hypothetical protein